MASPPVLVLPNFELPFEVECDAAGRGIRAVLIQQRKPIAFFSKALSEGNLAKSVYEKELMAITSPDQQGWLAKLLGYHFEVKYKPGLENKAADALSRCYDDVELKTLMSYPTWVDSKSLLDEVAADTDIQVLIQELHKNPAAKPGYCVKNGVLFYHGRLVISPKSPSIPMLLEEYHCTLAGGHSGFLRTYRRLAENLYWVGMQRSVRDFVRACDTCQRQKYSATIPG
ncbi:RNA-directed DNA polymerase (Reverse transcriptase), partial [Trifolium medium]|nr:RNA-directed DNA polymerase (Reverse transcriptase) [Trifolium medium]